MTIAIGRTSSGSLDRVAARPMFIAVVFFVSGFPALLYQLTWQRLLFAIYGINVEAVTVVVAGFLFGLGIGSLAGGRLSRTAGCSLLGLFGLVEISIGLFGVFSLRLFAFVGAHTLFLPMAGTTLTVLALLFLPTLLMGSTLPILTAYLLRRAPSVGRSVGLLYCVNTLGSSTACFACAFGLMRLTGMQGEVELAASINLLIGCVAFTEAWRTRSRQEDGLAVPTEDTTGDARAAGSAMPFSLSAAILLAGIVGFVSLSYEIVWFRAFVLANNTAAAFAIVLGTYLAGIANGSLRTRRLFEAPFSQRRASSIIAAALFSASLLGFLLLPLTAAAVFAGFGYFYPMLILVFAQATVLGGLFPIICHCSILGEPGAGARVSRVYLGNIIGSVGGTLLTGFVLMDHLSLAALSLSLMLLGIAIALPLGWLALPRRGARIALVAVSIAVAAILPAAHQPLFSRVYEALTYKAAPPADERFVDIVENKSGVIAVNGRRTVYGGGAYDGMISLDMLDDPNLLIRPFSLKSLSPRAATGADDRARDRRLGAGHREQPFCQASDHHRDQPWLSADHRSAPRSRRSVEQSQGDDRHRRRAAVAEPPS